MVFNLKSMKLCIKSIKTNSSQSFKIIFFRLFKEKYNQLLLDLNMLVPSTWHDNINILYYNNDSICPLSQKFNVDENIAVRRFREIKDTRK